MGTDLTKVLTPLAFFAMIALVVYFSAKYNYLTKKAILEKNSDVNFPKKKSPMLEIALTVIGFGIGLCFAAMLQTLNINEEVKGMFTGASIFICTGVGMLFAFYFRKRIERSGNQ